MLPTPPTVLAEEAAAKRVPERAADPVLRGKQAGEFQHAGDKKDDDGRKSAPTRLWPKLPCSLIRVHFRETWVTLPGWFQDQGSG